MQSANSTKWKPSTVKGEDRRQGGGIDATLSFQAFLVFTLPSQLFLSSSNQNIYYLSDRKTFGCHSTHFLDRFWHSMAENCAKLNDPTQKG